MSRRHALPFPSMDDIFKPIRRGNKTPDRNSSQEHLSCSPPSPSMHTTPPNPKIWQAKLRGARAAYIADDFLTATRLSYELLRDDKTVPYWARAQAALIITAYDAYPGDKELYTTAVSMVEAIKKMEQEQVEPNYKSLQLKIEGKQDGNKSSDEKTSGSLKKELTQVEEDVAGEELSGIDNRDIGIELRKLDRAQLDGNGDTTCNPRDKRVGNPEAEGMGKSDDKDVAISEDTAAKSSVSAGEETKNNSEDTVSPEDKGEEHISSAGEQTKNNSEDTDGKAEGEAAKKAESDTERCCCTGCTIA